jgi:hypothetical protein
MPKMFLDMCLLLLRHERITFPDPHILIIGSIVHKQFEFSAISSKEQEETGSPGATGGGVVWESSMNRTNRFVDVPRIA